MSTPSPYETILLALAAYRVWHLIALDDIAAPLRQALVGVQRIGPGGVAVAFKRRWIASWIDCPWCLGFWVAVAWWAAWLVEPGWVVGLAVPFALSALLCIVNWYMSEPD